MHAGAAIDLAALFGLGEDDLASLPDRSPEAIIALAARKGVLAEPDGMALLDRVIGNLRRAGSLLARHRPRPCNAPILHIRASDEPDIDDAAFDWAPYTRTTVTIVSLPCRHGQMLDPEHACAIARYLA